MINEEEKETHTHIYKLLVSIITMTRRRKRRGRESARVAWKQITSTHIHARIHCLLIIAENYSPENDHIQAVCFSLLAISQRKERRKKRKRATKREKKWRIDYRTIFSFVLEKTLSIDHKTVSMLHVKVYSTTECLTDCIQYAKKKKKERGKIITERIERINIHTYLVFCQ